MCLKIVGWLFLQVMPMASLIEESRKHVDRALELESYFWVIHYLDSWVCYFEERYSGGLEPCGRDDTPVIMQAFMDAKAAGAGSVVQLLEGEYPPRGLIEIRDFHGSFRGAGKDMTIITAMNNPDVQALIAQGFGEQVFRPLVPDRGNK